MGNDQYDDVHFENDDSSFIYTSIQILYKIPLNNLEFHSISFLYHIKIYFSKR